MKICYECKESKPLEAFSPWPRTKDGRYSYCRPCANKRNRLWSKAKYASDPNWYRRGNIRSKYGITLEQFDAILAQQGGGCAACGRYSAAIGRKMHVDHDHVTGKVRAVLCHPCNTALGLLDDSVERIQQLMDYRLNH